jgi:hypothetical protein
VTTEWLCRFPVPLFALALNSSRESSIELLM